MRIRVVATAASSELCSHSLLNLKNTKTLDGHCTITFFFLIWSEMSWCRWRDEAQRIFSWLCLAANCRNSRQQPDRVVKLYVVCVALACWVFPSPIQPHGLLFVYCPSTSPLSFVRPDILSSPLSYLSLSLSTLFIHFSLSFSPFSESPHLFLERDPLVRLYYSDSSVFLFIFMSDDIPFFFHYKNKRKQISFPLSSSQMTRAGVLERDWTLFKNMDGGNFKFFAKYVVHSSGQNSNRFLTLVFKWWTTRLIFKRGGGTTYEGIYPSWPKLL